MRQQNCCRIGGSREHLGPPLGGANRTARGNPGEVEGEILEDNLTIDVDPQPRTDCIQFGKDFRDRLRGDQLRKRSQGRVEVDIGDLFLRRLMDQVEQILKQQVEYVQPFFKILFLLPENFGGHNDAFC